jgi:WD40 repeat protein
MTLTLSGSYTLSRPFLQQGKLLLSSCGSIIKLISTATGELLDSLTGHQSNTSSTLPHPTNSDYVISSSDDGTIIVWNLVTKKLVFERKLPLSISEMIPNLGQTKDIPVLPSELILIVKKSGTVSESDETNKIIIYNLDKNKTRKNEKNQISDLKYASNCCDLLPAKKSSAAFNYLVIAKEKEINPLVTWSGCHRCLHTNRISRIPWSKSKQSALRVLLLSLLTRCLPDRDLVLTGHER